MATNPLPSAESNSVVGPATTFSKLQLASKYPALNAEYDSAYKSNFETYYNGYYESQAKTIDESDMPRADKENSYRRLATDARMGANRYATDATLSAFAPRLAKLNDPAVFSYSNVDPGVPTIPATTAAELTTSTNYGFNEFELEKKQPELSEEYKKLYNETLEKETEKRYRLLKEKNPPANSAQDSFYRLQAAEIAAAKAKLSTVDQLAPKLANLQDPDIFRESYAVSTSGSNVTVSDIGKVEVVGSTAELVKTETAASKLGITPTTNLEKYEQELQSQKSDLTAIKDSIAVDVDKTKKEIAQLEQDLSKLDNPAPRAGLGTIADIVTGNFNFYTNDDRERIDTEIKNKKIELTNLESRIPGINAQLNEVDSRLTVVNQQQDARLQAFQANKINITGLNVDPLVDPAGAKADAATLANAGPISAVSNSIDNLKNSKATIARQIQALEASKSGKSPYEILAIQRDINKLNEALVQTDKKIVENQAELDRLNKQARDDRERRANQVSPQVAAAAARRKDEEEKALANVAAQRAQSSQGDWRVKLRLAGGAKYLYKAEDPGILKPLAATDGIIFPYMPTVNISYQATYGQSDIAHTNYKSYFYQNSAVGEISLDATFTAQDTVEANYLLAVLHFFKSATKMFYGQDTNEFKGSPPPLVFLQGLGDFQFNLAPCVIQNFTYVLPNDVDYIRANTSLLKDIKSNVATGAETSVSSARLSNANIPPGGVFASPSPTSATSGEVTYVPSKMQIQLMLLPVQTRSQISKQFSYNDYASGKLIKKGFW